MLAHLVRTRCTVQTNHVDPQRLQRCQGCTNLRAHQHGACGLDGHVDDDRNLFVSLSHGGLDTVDGRLYLQQVLTGLNQKRIRATGNHAESGLRVCVAKLSVRSVPQRWQLRARAQRTEDKASHTLAPRPHFVSDLAGDCGALVR